MEPHRIGDHQLELLGGSWTSTMRVVGYPYRQVQKHLSLAFNEDVDASRVLQHLRDALSLARSHLSFENKTKAWIDTFNMSSGPSVHPTTSRSSATKRSPKSASPSTGSRTNDLGKLTERLDAQERMISDILVSLRSSSTATSPPTSSHERVACEHLPSQSPADHTSFDKVVYFTDISGLETGKLPDSHTKPADPTSGSHVPTIQEQKRKEKENVCLKEPIRDGRQGPNDSRSPTSVQDIRTDFVRRMCKSPEETRTGQSGQTCTAHGQIESNPSTSQYVNSNPSTSIAQCPSTSPSKLVATPAPCHATSSSASDVLPSSTTTSKLDKASSTSAPSLPLFSKVDISKLDESSDSDIEQIFNDPDKHFNPAKEFKPFREEVREDASSVSIKQRISDHLDQLRQEQYPSPVQLFHRLRKSGYTSLTIRKDLDFVHQCLHEHYYRRFPMG